MLSQTGLGNTNTANRLRAQGSNRLAAIAGPLCYGLVSCWSGGNHRLAILVTLFFFIAGLILLLRVDEQRGKVATLEYAPAMNKVATVMTPME